MDFDSNSVDLESLDGSTQLGRRSFLIGALATGAAAAAPLNYAAKARARAVPLAKSGSFKLGVSSGFPRPKGIVLWTRLGGAERNSKLKFTVAKDRGFKNIVREGATTARADRDFTARTFVKGLKPGEQYFYRFHTQNSDSEIGRFRTAPPADSKQPLKIVFYSCQNYQAGYFNVQRAIAKEKDVDLVICLGDYVYESDYYSEDRVRADTTGRNHDGVVEFIDEWREKYRLYKSDPDLKAMHAAHPFTSIWDDHEVEDNYADGKNSPHATPGETNDGHPRRMPFTERKLNGYKAFFNYHARERFKGDRDRIYEHRRMGKLLDLIITDERQYRDQQPCNDPIVTPCADAANPRAMLGPQQKAWFKKTLSGSQANWKIWGNEVMLMGFEVSAAADAIMDEWDGYKAERTELMNYINSNNIGNVVGITGDIHNFYAGTVTTTGKADGAPAMTEFVGGSATSRGLPEETGLTPSFFESVKALNPSWKYAEFANRGYAVLDIKPNEVQCTFKRPTTVTSRNNGATVQMAKFRVASGSKTMDQLA